MVSRAGAATEQKRRRRRGIRLAWSDRVYNVVNNMILGVILIAILYPLIYIFSSSFSSPMAVLSGKVWLYPVEPSIEAYKVIFDYRLIWTGYANTVFYAGAGSAISVMLTLLAAYPLSRKVFRGKNFYMFLFAFTMIFNGGIIPTYLVVKNVGIMNTRWAILLPSAVAAWNIIITRTYYQVNIPTELLEAAHLDGCDDIQFFRLVVLPLSGAITAVNALFYAVAKWNAFFEAFIYLKDQNLWPLQIVLRTILVINTMDANLYAISASSEIARQGLRELLRFSLIVVASVPVLIMYPFVQRYFVKGVMIGSLKG
jgi:multiple sugar transport system permease protein/putative aldouronate transport system permease protein